MRFSEIAKTKSVQIQPVSISVLQGTNTATDATCDEMYSD